MLPTLFLALAPLQQTPGRPILQRYTRPLEIVTFDADTGTVTRGPKVRPQAANTTADLSHLKLSTFIAIETGGGFCEWLDSGRKGRTDHGHTPVPSDLVSGFVFPYCTSAGSNGGTMTWTFYPQHTSGANHPDPATAVGAFTLAGLPGNTASGGGFSCFLVQVDFGNVPLAYPDGQVGYSWTFEDLQPMSTLAATVPILACVSSCSGPGPDAQGFDDILDRYCPAGVAGAPPQSFSFGTTAFGGYFSSLAIEIREYDVSATTSAYNGTAVANPDTLLASPIIIGQDWTATVLPQPQRTTAGLFAGTFLVLLRMGGPPASSIVLDLGSLLLPPPNDAPLSELLVTGGGLPLLGGNWALGTPASFPVPANTNLLCMPWYAQAVVFGDLPFDGDTEADPMLSSGVQGVVGAQ